MKNKKQKAKSQKSKKKAKSTIISNPNSEVDLNKLLGTIKKPLKIDAPKDTLSVCMIVKNEEKNIEAAIRSFIPFADEIIVNDTGSTDETVNILKRLPVKIIETKWEGDFSKARNQAIDEATKSWVIWLDADDRVPVEEIENFRMLKTAPLDRCFGFQVINTQAGQPIGTRFMQVRMFPNHKDLRFERKVHEQIILSCARMGLHSMCTETTVWHTGYEDPVVKKQKAERNLELLALEPKAHDPVMNMQDGDSYAILERWAESIEAYKRALEVPRCKEINKDVWMECPNQIGRNYQKLANYEQALLWFEEGMKRSEKLEPVFFSAEVHEKLGNTEMAEKWYKETLSRPLFHSAVSNQYDVLRIHAFHNLCKILDAKGEPFQAEYMERANEFLKAYPNVVESSIHIAMSFFRQKKYRESLEYFKNCLKHRSKNEAELWANYAIALEESDAEPGLFFEAQKRSRELGKVNSPRPTQISFAPKLSIVMIVRDEEANLGACLESVVGLWDELIVVDTGSVDRTVEIAKSYGADVHHFEWVGDFSKARNYSISKAKGNWILWLDADDCVPKSEHLLIKELSTETSKERMTSSKAYGFRIQNSTDNGATGAIFNQIRMFPNNRGLEFEGRVHEQLMPSIQSLNMGVEFVPIKVLHTGYTDDAIIKVKQERNLYIMEEEIQNSQSITAVKLYSIAGAYQDLKRYVEAIEWYIKALNQAIRVGEDPHVAKHSPVKIGQCLASLGRLDEAYQKVSEVLVTDPKNVEAVLLLAKVLEEKGLKLEACEVYNRLFLFEEEDTLLPVDFQWVKIQAIRFLGEYWKSENQIEIAIQFLKWGVKLKEGYRLSLNEIIDLYFEFEAYDSLVKLLDYNEKLGQSVSVHFLESAKACILMNKLDKGIELLEEGLRRYPGNADLAQLKTMVLSDIGK